MTACVSGCVDRNSQAKNGQPMMDQEMDYDWLANQHDHFSLSTTVELAEKDSLPAAEQ